MGNLGVSWKKVIENKRDLSPQWRESMRKFNENGERMKPILERQAHQSFLDASRYWDGSW